MTVLHALPRGLLGKSARALHEVLPGPTLIHLPGRRSPPLFVSVLLHGNEDVGWRAVQRLLGECGGRALPRALSLFVGNVAAAREGQRRLPGQPDYNRVWPGGGATGCAEERVMQAVVDEMARLGVFASVDVHNNTGTNPHYACVNRLDARFLSLAVLFSRTVVYFLRPTGVQSMAFAGLCPAVTLECGKVGEQAGVDHAARFLSACLHLSDLPARPPAAHDIELFHTVAVLRLAHGSGASRPNRPCDGGWIRFVPDFDRLNFQELPAGTLLAHADATGEAPLQVWGEGGEDLTGRFLQQNGRDIRLRRPVMPAMLTLDQTVMQQDCVGYFMERLRGPLRR